MSWQKALLTLPFWLAVFLVVPTYIHNDLLRDAFPLIVTFIVVALAREDAPRVALLPLAACFFSLFLFTLTRSYWVFVPFAVFLALFWWAERQATKALASE